MNINRLLIIFAWIFCIQGGYAAPEPGSLYSQAQTLYDKGNYAQALSTIKQAIAVTPDNSHYQHLLGKCYGRLAENANWFKAVSLTTKTRKALEKAVELDKWNVSALRDLMKFYQQAPEFLGGDEEKAAQIEQFLTTIDMPG